MLILKDRSGEWKIRISRAGLELMEFPLTTLCVSSASTQPRAHGYDGTTHAHRLQRGG